MPLTIGNFYRDREGDVWQAVTPVILALVAFGDGSSGIEPFDFVPVPNVEKDYGPLTEVRPTGWEAV